MGAIRHGVAHHSGHGAHMAVIVLLVLVATAVDSWPMRNGWSMQAHSALMPAHAAQTSYGCG